ncbi:MAG TPA: 16S rRNA (guanine(527)-N(7))-methyltransferase RsmG [Candidatus Angelobacter sp.]|nr:16S rRNA (guanine(527)-N(7))-methyltransferase RsmG [Candidatus Angelobacter sp.]
MPATESGTGQPPVREETDLLVEQRLRARYPAAAEVLGRYAALLATDGVERGLIGPREVGRLWSRHVANCAVLEELVPQGVSVADVGSGAGLPGLPLALVRDDLRVVLVEPLLRRATFLTEAVAALGLADRVDVLRGRAEEQRLEVDVVTARAVAPLDRLAGWTLPLVRVGGVLLALKGEGAAAEVAASAAALERLGGGQTEVLGCGVGVVEPPTTVVRVVRLTAGRRKGTR